MLQFFQDDGTRVFHNEFQEWRRHHPDGFYLNLSAKKGWMLHRAVGCHHPGNTSWTCEESGASLTRHRKVCSPQQDELMAWAHKKQLNVARCVHCRL